MKDIRGAIREELAKALLKIKESVKFVKNNEQIIHNFDGGRAFGINQLSKDIDGLNMYYMNIYFPNSEMKESWTFETEAKYGGSQVIEIIHQIGDDYNSYWKLNISTVERDSSQPQLIATSDMIEGYDNFIEYVNLSLKNKIDTSLL
jgi:hypothetical protein